MNRLNTLLLLLFISFCVIPSHVTANETASTSNYEIIPFVNERLKTFINKLFNSLKISKKFKRSYKTKLLLIMYANLNNAIEFNWNTYSKIKNSVAVADFVKNNYYYKLVTDVLKTIDIEHNNSSERNFISLAFTEDEKNHTAVNDEKSTINITTVSTNEDGPPQKDMLDEFMYKINKLTAEELINHPINKTYLEIDEKKRYKIFRRNNFDLKAWDPNELPDDRLSITRRMATAELVKKYPFIASIHVMEKFTCTGSILSKNAVLTAASCLPFSYDTKMIQQMPDIIHVRVGSDYANHYGEKVPIVDVEFHPEYETKTLKNNIAIIRLTKLQKYAKSRPKLRKIRLDRRPGAVRNDLRNVYILGFGAGNEDLKEDSQQLVAVSLDLMPFEKCKDIYSGQFVSEMDFCAGFKPSRRNSRCNGDVGAPGVADGFLVGIVSFGPPVCGRHDAPTVFIQVSTFSGWIDHIVNEKFKVPHPGDNSGSREFRSTRLFLEEDENTFAGVGSMRTTAHATNHAKKHHVFKEIKTILTHMSNPTDHHRYTRKPTPKLVNNDDDAEDDPLQLVYEDAKTTPLLQHPLINKSVIPVPGIHYPTKSTYYWTTTRVSRPDIGLPSNLPYDYIADRIKTSEELDYFLKLLLKDNGENGPELLSWQKRMPPKVLSTNNSKRNKENVKESHEHKMAKISKNMQKNKRNNINLQLRNNAKIDGGSTPYTRTTLNPQEKNIFKGYGNGKIIGDTITRPVTLLEFYNQ